MNCRQKASHRHPPPTHGSLAQKGHRINQLKKLPTCLVGYSTRSAKISLLLLCSFLFPFCVLLLLLLSPSLCSLSVFCLRSTTTTTTTTTTTHIGWPWDRDGISRPMKILSHPIKVGPGPG